MPIRPRRWNEYPPIYLKLLDRLIDGAPMGIDEALARLTKREANSRRMDLYRFFGRLREAADDPTSRDHAIARAYADAANQTQIFVMLTAPDEYAIELRPNLGAEYATTRGARDRAFGQKTESGNLVARSQSLSADDIVRRMRDNGKLKGI